jgi:hypothetical protein
MGLAGAAIWVELSFEIVAPTYRMAEPGGPFRPVAQPDGRACGEAHLVTPRLNAGIPRLPKIAYEWKIYAQPTNSRRMGLRAPWANRAGMCEARWAPWSNTTSAPRTGHNGARPGAAEARSGPARRGKHPKAPCWYLQRLSDPLATWS